MKLLTPERPKRPANDDTMLQGIEVALTVGLFFGIGYFLDRWLGTTPWLMIVFVLLAGVGFFAKFKYQYDAKLDREIAKREALEQGRELPS